MNEKWKEFREQLSYDNDSLHKIHVMFATLNFITDEERMECFEFIARLHYDYKQRQDSLIDEHAQNPD